MPLFHHCIVVLFILCLYANGVWSINIHKKVYYGHTSSKEEMDIGFKSSNAQYYNSREAHGDSIDIVDGTNLTEHYFTSSNENSNEENPGSISTILEGYLNKSGVDKYPYPLRIGSQDSYELSHYNSDTVKISLDISDYLEALADKQGSDNENIVPLNARKDYGQAQSGVIFAEHRYSMPLSNSHILDTESKEMSSQETFGIYSKDTETVRYDELNSAESSETTESWLFLTEGQSRLRPGVLQDFNTTEVSLPQCSVSKNKIKQNKCQKEQNLCRSTGDCRISRIWGTCCNSPSCGSYCKPNRSNCPHPNSIKVACDIKSDELCIPHKGECLGETSCCQTPCGYRCV